MLSASPDIFRQEIRTLVEQHVWPIAAELDASDEYSPQLTEIFGRAGLLQLWLPTEHGGPGGDITKVCIAREEVARASLAASVLCSNNALGLILPLLHFGNDEPRARFFPACAAGKMLTSTAMTEPDTGSDVAGMRTTATRLPSGSYRLNGHKAWVTWAAQANNVLVFAKTSQGPASESISAFLVDTKLPGYRVVRKIGKSGRNGAPNYDVVLDDLEVEARDLVGAEGKGFIACMNLLDLHRPTVAASSLGLAQEALDISLAYANMRVQFGRPVGQFQGMQFKLADMAMKIEAARTLLYSTCQEIGGGDLSRLSLLASMTKCFVSDVAMDVATEAFQVLGAYGSSQEYPVDRMMRDAKLNQLLEGTNEIHRMLIGKRLLAEEARRPTHHLRKYPRPPQELI